MDPFRENHVRVSRLLWRLKLHVLPSSVCKAFIPTRYLILLHLAPGTLRSLVAIQQHSRRDS